MIIYPAIDLMGGKCVRLVQGKRENCTVYSDRPEEIALKWANAGAMWLHVVDLDAALDQKCFSNLDAIKKILKKVSGSGVKVQVGGGIRTTDDIQTYLDEGISRVILGTVALKYMTESPDVLEGIFEVHGEKVAVGIDSVDGKVIVKGWTACTEFEVVLTALYMYRYGARVLIFTDIKRDGMLTEPNFELMKTLTEVDLIKEKSLDVEFVKFLSRFWRPGTLKIIASGGVASIDHIRYLFHNCGSNLNGVIVGKALYEGKMDLREAIDNYQF